MQQLATREEPTGEDRWARWTSAWAIASVPGVCLAVLAWGTMPVVITAVITTVLMTLGLACHASFERLRVGWIAEVAVGVAALVVSVSALGVVLPLVAQLGVVLGVATSPPLAAVRHWVVEQLVS